MSSFAAQPGFTAPRVRTTRPVRSARPVAVAASLPESGAVRLTRRGRLVLTLVFLGLVMATLTVFGARSAATGEAGQPVPTRTVMVDRGDTLWEIAASVAKPGETRAMVYKIQELNALPDSGLYVGQRIAVPVG